MKYNMRVLFKIISIILLMSVIAAFACYMVFLYPTSTFRVRDDRCQIFTFKRYC